MIDKHPASAIPDVVPLAKAYLARLTHWRQLKPWQVDQATEALRLFVREIEHWRWVGSEIRFRLRTTPPVRALDGSPDRPMQTSAVPQPSVPKFEVLDSDRADKNSHKDPVYAAVEAMRLTLRGGHYARNTESTYLSWVKRYLAFCGGEEKARALGTRGAKTFLEALACRGKVTASTQNQAFSALLFLFRHVWKLSLEDMETTLRARRSEKLPTVLSNAEVAEVLQGVGTEGGAGLCCICSMAVDCGCGRAFTYG